jgi:hypothetical protein
VQKIKCLFWLLAMGWTPVLMAQNVELKGVVRANSDVENIHVINRTANKFSTTNSKGQFKILAKLGDSIQFTSVKFKTEVVIVSMEHISQEKLEVFLIEQINELDEVVVGKVLTGTLESDINNSDAKRDINFFDVGIPGYKGKPKTQSERRLHEADAGNFVYVGLGVGVNLNKILNRISGRTKKLKERVRVETNDAIMRDIRDRLSKDFFATNPLDVKHHNDFFFFCTDDPDFQIRCKQKSDLEVIIYLSEKLKVYKSNLALSKD